MGSMKTGERPFRTRSFKRKWKRPDPAAVGASAIERTFHDSNRLRAPWSEVILDKKEESCVQVASLYDRLMELLEDQCQPSSIMLSREERERIYRGDEDTVCLETSFLVRIVAIMPDASPEV